MTIQDLRAMARSLCFQTDEVLWDIYHWKDSSRPPPGLIFAHYSLKKQTDVPKKRISEQEARLAFIQAVIVAKKLYYSIETPTQEKYCFNANKTHRSARTDLTLYGVPLYSSENQINIEFKAKVASLKSPPKDKPNQSCLNIAKDIEKLCREECGGLWFHVLKNTNSKTISSLLAVFEDALQKRKYLYSEETYEVKSPYLGLHICVLHKKFSMHHPNILEAGLLEKTRKQLLSVSAPESQLHQLEELGWVVRTK